MMSTRFSAASRIAANGVPAKLVAVSLFHIEPVLSITSASSMPVVWRSMTVRAETFISSWPKTRMK